VSDDPDLIIDTPVTLTVSGPGGTSTANATVRVFDPRGTLFGTQQQKRPAKPGGDD